MPKREAMNHLGHQSRAIHSAYGCGSRVIVFPLEHYEELKHQKIVAFTGTEKGSNITAASQSLLGIS
jgi:hypothetical protein